MLDTLVDGQDGKKAGVGQSSCAVKRLQGAKNGNRSVGSGPDAIDEIRPRSVDGRCGDGFALVAQKSFGFFTQKVAVIGFSSSCSHNNTSLEMGAAFAR